MESIWTNNNNMQHADNVGHYIQQWTIICLLLLAFILIISFSCCYICKTAKLILNQQNNNNNNDHEENVVYEESKQSINNKCNRSISTCSAPPPDRVHFHLEDLDVERMVSICQQQQQHNNNKTDPSTSNICTNQQQTIKSNELRKREQLASKKRQKWIRCCSTIDKHLEYFPSGAGSLDQNQLINCAHCKLFIAETSSDGIEGDIKNCRKHVDDCGRPLPRQLSPTNLNVNESSLDDATIMNQMQHFNKTEQNNLQHGHFARLKHYGQTEIRMEYIGYTIASNYSKQQTEQIIVSKRFRRLVAYFDRYPHDNVSKLLGLLTIPNNATITDIHHNQNKQIKLINQTIKYQQQKQDLETGILPQDISENEDEMLTRHSEPDRQRNQKHIVGCFQFFKQPLNSNRQLYFNNNPTSIRRRVIMQDEHHNEQPETHHKLKQNIKEDCQCQNPTKIYRHYLIWQMSQHHYRPLWDVLHGNVKLSWPIKLSFINDIIQGMIYLHQCKLINGHGWLNSRNCLINNAWQVKIYNQHLVDQQFYHINNGNDNNGDDGNDFEAEEMLFTRSQGQKHQTNHQQSAAEQSDQKDRICSSIFRRTTILLNGKRKRTVKVAPPPPDQTQQQPTKSNMMRMIAAQPDPILRLWMAPELLLKMDHVSDDLIDMKKCDIYSYGMLSYEICCQRVPFHDHLCTEENLRVVLELIKHGQHFKHQHPTDVSEPLKDEPLPLRPKLCNHLISKRKYQCLWKMLESCWQQSPDQRPTFQQIDQYFRSTFKNLRDGTFESLINKLNNVRCIIDERVRKRTAFLEEEKNKSDELLYRLLPITVAKALKNGEYVKPEQYDNVTILFSDIVGFTTIASYSEPIETISILNNLFAVFDSIVKKYDVYKVETIGDAYLAVSGLPHRNTNHAEQIAMVALEFIDWSLRFKIEHMPTIPLRIRIGVHTGSVVTGVVGLTNPRYCIFGDSVNVASRLESTGQPNSIHISHSTERWLRSYQDFVVEYRGTILLKGRGEYATYWLLGRKGSLINQLTVPDSNKENADNNHGIVNETAFTSIGLNKQRL